MGGHRAPRSWCGPIPTKLSLDRRCRRRFALRTNASHFVRLSVSIQRFSRQGGTSMARFSAWRVLALDTSLLVFLGFVSLTGGCSSSSESAKRDTLTADVGKYP